jgi:hypothetical protein
MGERFNIGPACALVLIAALAFAGAFHCARVLVHVAPESSLADKKAVLVLPGLRNSGKGHRAAKRWYPAQGYDAFVPDYVSREGFPEHVANLASFIEEHRLAEYGELHAFVYLMGGWTLNMYLAEHELPNLEKIVYDRSPYQEQGPRIVLANMGWLIHLIYGRPVDHLRDTPYPPLPKGDRQIGMIVETRVTPYVKRHREDLRPIPDEDWLPEAFDQEHDDLIYVHLHHDEMYYSFEEIGPELLSFFETGSFTAGAARERGDQDPFE